MHPTPQAAPPATCTGLTQAEHRAIRAIADQAAPARRYLTPVTAHTGARWQRPSVGQTRHEWYFDANGAYQDESGPLDATDLIPLGGVRALDCPELTLGIATISRPA